MLNIFRVLYFRVLHKPRKYFYNENFQIYSNIDLHDVFPFVTAVECGNLTDPANGQVDHTAGTTLGQTVYYSCNTGYNLVGDRTHTCQASGNWSGSAPICQGVYVCKLTHW